MPQLLWDASALIKRYVAENGSQTVIRMFTLLPAHSMVITYLGYAETSAIMRRNLNRGDIDIIAFRQARHLLQSEILLDPDFTLLTINDADFLAGIGFTDRHNLNSTDAAILAVYKGYAQAHPSSAPHVLLVASDQRLLRAAQAEGLQTLNPEIIASTDVPAVLAGS